MSSKTIVSRFRASTGTFTYSTAMRNLHPFARANEFEGVRIV